jgi:outer membrane receptor protein involved in Fe transport
VIITGVAANTVAACRSDSDGKFVFTSLDAGQYRVTASAPGLASDAMPIDDRRIRRRRSTSRCTSARSRKRSSSRRGQIDQPLSRIPDSVTVIPGAEIDAKQQFMLASALRSVPGLTLQQNGGPGTVTSLFTRGGESDFTLVMIDGIRANAFGGGLDLSQVPLQDVERIEVIRGPQSALYGSDAIGGVINVITRSGGSPSALAHIETGSRDMLRASGATTGEKKRRALATRRELLRGRRLHRHRREWGDRVERRRAGATGVGVDRLASRHGGLRSARLDSVRRHRTWCAGPYGSDPANRYGGVDTVSRGTD